MARGAEEGEHAADGEVVYVVAGHGRVSAGAAEAGESDDDEGGVVREEVGLGVEV